MHTNDITCILYGLKVEVMLINSETVLNSLTPQFDESVQVTNSLFTNNNTHYINVVDYAKY